MKIIIKFILFLLIFLSISLAQSGQKKSDNFRLPLGQRIQAWDKIAGKGAYKADENNFTATFEKDGHSWTILAADLPVVAPTVYPDVWPVKGEAMDVLVIPEPITNYKILPFTERIENAVPACSFVSLLA